MTWPQTNTHKPRKHEKTQNPKPEAEAATTALVYPLGVLNYN